MEFILIVIVLCGFYALYRRQGIALDRLDRIEREVGGLRGYGDVLPVTRREGHSVESTPLPENNGDETLASRIRAYSMNAPAPAPAPAPDYALLRSVGTSADVVVDATRPEKFADDAQEEKSARWLGRIGGFMIFVGMVLFVRYSINVGLLTDVGQFILGILVGILMVGIGHFLRARHGGDLGYERFASVLLGGGVAVLYLIIFAGFSVFELSNGAPVITQTTAFVLMMFVTAMTMVLSVVANSRFLALSAVIGGFLTPIMVSSGENHLVTLALYITILNMGVVGIGMYKKWSWLHYSALLGTVILFGGWMERYYFGAPEGQLGLTFLFLTIFFVQFLATAVMHHFRGKEESTSTDLVFLLLNAGLYFGSALSVLWVDYRDFLGFFALLLAMVHLTVAYLSYTSTLRDRTLNLFLIGVAVVFLSVAVPLQLSGYWVSLSWLVEAVVLITIGVYLREKVLRMFGWIVFALGISSVLEDVSQIRYGFGVDRGGYLLGNAQLPDFVPFLNSAFAMLVITVVSLYAVAYAYAKLSKEEGEWKTLVLVMLIASNLVTLYAITSEITIKYDKMIQAVRTEASSQAQAQEVYLGGKNSYYDYSAQKYVYLSSESSKKIAGLENQKKTVQSVFWTLYAILLLVLGFVRRMRALRIGGLVLIFVTAFQVFVMVWGLGQPYNIIASLVFGVLALSASFIYVKYKHLLTDIITDDNDKK